MFTRVLTGILTGILKGIHRTDRSIHKSIHKNTHRNTYSNTQDKQEHSQEYSQESSQDFSQEQPQEHSQGANHPFLVFAWVLSLGGMGCMLLVRVLRRYPLKPMQIHSSVSNKSAKPIQNATTYELKSRQSMQIQLKTTRLCTKD